MKGMNDPRVWAQLTTPVTYLDSLPLDPFLGAIRAVSDDGSGNAAMAGIPYYQYYGTAWLHEVIQISLLSPDDFIAQWVMGSPGPSRVWSYGEWSIYKSLRDAGSPRVYDPSNGATSFGDIVRWENMERTLVAPIE